MAIDSKLDKSIGPLSFNDVATSASPFANVFMLSTKVSIGLLPKLINLDIPSNIFAALISSIASEKLFIPLNDLPSIWPNACINADKF